MAAEVGTAMEEAKVSDGEGATEAVAAVAAALPRDDRERGESALSARRRRSSSVRTHGRAWRVRRSRT